jgi:hypothetical protein
MKKLIDWLSQHRAFNLLLILIYFIAVVLPHKRFGTFLNTEVFKRMTRDEYNQLVLFIGLILLSIFVLIFLRNSAKTEFKRRLWIYMGVNILSAVLALNLLFVVNIEVIHFPQYAFFALLTFPLLLNYQQTLIWATLAGAIDEAYQYFYLSPNDTGYYDFNDVLTNLIGVVFGLLFLRSFNIKESSRPKFLKSSAFMALVGLSVIIATACFSGILSIYPSDITHYQIVREMPTGFWSTVPPEISYHVMLPIEGMIITVLMTLFYYQIGKD